MNALIAALFTRARSVILLLVLILSAGAYSYITIPKEAAPEFYIPFFVVSVSYPGISSEDSSRLLVEPLERKLQSLEGLRQMTARAGEGFATVILEFDPGYDQQQAIQSVRDETDNATPDLPSGANRPVIREIDISLFPVLTISLSGNVPERELNLIARELEEKLETISGVLEVDLSGLREDLLEIVIDPLAMQSYGISPQQIHQAIRNNNQLITAGTFDTGAGRIGLSVPGTIQTQQDIEAMPVKVTDNTVVRVKDVAQVRQTFQDADSFARVNNYPTIALDVRKTSGANIIETVADVQASVEQMRQDWPDTLKVDYLQDQADNIKTLLGDLQNNVISAVVLVSLTMILALGLRASLLVSIAIPGAFMGGILAINMLGFTLNIVVLFGLILVIGMLVDGAIIVVERAERLQQEGKTAKQAFLKASQYMAWPITASTATTLAVFFPLLFWPGTAGQFMFYLPATVILTLSMSLLMALIFVPVMGSLLSNKTAQDQPREYTTLSETKNRFSRLYERILKAMIQQPGLVVGLTLFTLIVSIMLYSHYGRGVNFFPDIEPERAQLQIQADGNLSLQEADKIVRMVEQRIIGTDGIERLYSRTIASVEDRLNANLSPDVIGTIQINFLDWRERESADRILNKIRQLTSDLPGVGVQIEKEQSGPGEARPIQIQVSADQREDLLPNLQKIKRLMAQQDKFTDISSDAPMPHVEIRVEVNREQAARYGVDIATIGSAVQLLTNGVLIGSYLPDFARDEVDIRLRYPANERTFAQLANLRISTTDGMVPIANFVRLVGVPNHPLINRVDARNVQTLSADVKSNTTAAKELAVLRESLKNIDLDPGVEVSFTGELEDMQEAAEFLILAFLLAVFLMLLILLTQFNSFFQALLVLSAIVFSIAGVFLGLILRQEAFSIVMSGIGIMALAGIVVNNNIVLIDAYNYYRSKGLNPNQAAQQAGTERLRPVLLTAITTIVGLLPMVMGLTIDFFERDLFFGAPSGQFWTQLSTGIVGGLTIATFITLLLTPSLLAWDGNRRLKTAQ
ncbi:efflux RND transporter permease subunit [Thiomicrospira pelophila]|uniref:efflux RND transporter permease subunit n=1 Tax=Thiomicrospira pelophila TaxID=934 RepID=UPI0004A6B276|nr:efflux RND transporter permease subunit [Thiomicrospira pelophila]